MSTNTVHGMFEFYALNDPNYTALIDGEHRISYAALNQKANQLAHYLKPKIKPDTLVALCMDRSIHLFVAILGILKAGGAYLPLSKEQPKDRLLYILNNAEVPILLCDEDLNNLFSDYSGLCINLPQIEKELEHYDNNNLNLPVDSHQLAYVIYTSGSTGLPKGVMIEHDSVVHYTRWFGEFCHLKPQQRIEFSANHIFDFAITVSLCPIMLGITVVLCSDAIKKNPRQYLEFINTQQIDFIKLTPGFFKLLLHELHNRFQELPHLSSLMTGGETLMASDCAQWLNYFPNQIIFNEYGPTETTVGACIYELTKENVPTEGKAPIANAGPNMVFYILDEQDKEVKPGSVGQLYIGGQCLARSYVNQPQMTAEKFIANPLKKSPYPRLYKTGDLFKQINSSHFEYIGRVDHQVKIRGFRVEPDEVNQALLKITAIRESIVIASEKQDREMQLHAYYVLKDNQFHSIEAIRQELSSTLPDYMIPSHFIALDKMPLNANGKVDRKALTELAVIQSTPYTAPKTKLQKTLAKIWEQALGIESIGIEDNFFELGGNSLSAGRIISDINKELNMDVAITEIYQNPNIKQISLKLKPLGIKPKQDFESEENSPSVLSDFQLMLWLSTTFRPQVRRMNLVSLKRFDGNLNREILIKALNRLVHKHEASSYYGAQFTPTLLVHNPGYILEEKNLEGLSPMELEKELNISLKTLLNHYPWPKNSPNLMVMVFRLTHSRYEIQIAMPHLISDEMSMHTLWLELDKEYKHIENNPEDTSHGLDKTYSKYLKEQQKLLKTYLANDLVFWKDYLNDAHFIRLPKEKVLETEVLEDFVYSSYVPIAQKDIDHFKTYCAKHQVHAQYGLCALTLLALRNCIDETIDESKKLYINLVKSTRDKEEYDKTIGCLLRVDALKTSLSKDDSLLTLIKKLQQSAFETAEHQNSSSLIKLAQIHNLNAHHSFKKRITRHLIHLYGTLFKINKLINTVLEHCANFIAHPYQNNFLLNINIQNSFFAEKNKTTLFNNDLIDRNEYQYDLLQVANCLDICFIKKEFPKKAYIVISANLKPEFREQIGRSMINIINNLDNPNNDAKGHKIRRVGKEEKRRAKQGESN